LAFVSSRYAFHGAGYTFTDLPYEKIEDLWLADKLYKMGAKKIAAVGISQAGFEEMVEKAIAGGGLKGEATQYSRSLTPVEIQRVLKRLKDPNELMGTLSEYPIDDKREPFLKQQRANLLNNKGLVGKLNQLARIDAVVGYF